jgi:four helix bundle protein
MNRKHPYHNLVIYKEGVEFIKLIYQHTETFPRHEIFGLTSQFRRAAVSSVTNVVEGHAKSSNKEKLRFFEISRASLRECAFYIELAEILRYISTEQAERIEDIR